MTPSQPSARMRSMPARVFTVQAKTRPPLLVDGGDRLGRDDVVPQRGVAGARPQHRRRPAWCGSTAPDRPGVMVALVRAWPFSAASEAMSPVENTHRSATPAVLARGERLALVAGRLQVDQEPELGRRDLRELARGSREHRPGPAAVVPDDEPGRHVELDHVHARADRRAHRGDGVLGRESGGAAMADAQHGRPSYHLHLAPCGPLAQLVEQGTFNPKVAGSIPARPTLERLG